MVLLPAPVAPTSAIFSPIRAPHDTSRITGAPGLYSNVTWSSSKASSSVARSRCRAASARRVLVFVVEELEDALGTRHRRLQHRVARRQIADGTEEHLDVGDEDEEGAEGDFVREGADAGVPEHRGDADAGDHLDGRVEGGVVDDGAVVGVAVRAVDLVELGRALRLARVRLEHGHARDMLVEVGVHARGLGAHLAERVADPPARPVDPERHRRRRRRRRGAPSSSPSQSMMVTMATRRSRSPTALSAPEANISLMASTSPVTRVTSRPTGVRSKKPSLRVCRKCEDVRAQIGHGARAGDLHQVHLGEGDGLLEDQHHRDHDPVAGERGAGYAQVVERAAHHQRAGDEDARDDEEHAHGDGEVASVRAHEGPDVEEHARVVRLLERALLVEAGERVLGPRLLLDGRAHAAPAVVATSAPPEGGASSSPRAARSSSMRCSSAKEA